MVYIIIIIISCWQLFVKMILIYSYFCISIKMREGRNVNSVSRIQVKKNNTKFQYL